MILLVKAISTLNRDVEVTCVVDVSYKRLDSRFARFCNYIPHLAENILRLSKFKSDLSYIICRFKSNIKVIFNEYQYI